jgi:hypothetical protein
MYKHRDLCIKAYYDDVIIGASITLINQELSCKDGWCCPSILILQKLLPCPNVCIHESGPFACLANGGRGEAGCESAWYMISRK